MYMAQERRQYILRLLEQRGSVRTTALARELGVTDETIRTDLVDMQARALLQRMHGGARYIMPTVPTASDSPRLDVQLAQLTSRQKRSPTFPKRPSIPLITDSPSSLLLQSG
jgi:DeoR/GlpR family transcriptional regulator of sugar metabolism